MGFNPASMGIDVGSTTAKMVILDSSAHTLYSAYERHNADTQATVGKMLADAHQTLGDLPVSLLVTGSAGMGIGEKYQFPFIQEVVASAEVVRQLYPEVRTLIDIGGEDAKMIFFDAEGQPDIRMNGACAGGTGAFIDQMAVLLNVPVSDMNGLAGASTKLYPIASRCGVFAKTDVQNLLSQDIPRPDIVASVFRAVVLQTMTTLARGNQPAPALLFCGGPLTFVPELRGHFLDVLHFTEEDVVAVERAELLPALGAALAPQAHRQETTLDQLLARWDGSSSQDQRQEGRLAPLFSDNQEYVAWQEARMRHQVPKVNLTRLEGANCYLGIDSGSTTTKLVLIDEQGRVAFHFYASNHGNSLEAVQLGLAELRRQWADLDNPPRIAGSAVTGYAEDLVRAALGIDYGIVETLAHYRAAKSLAPDVSFILDIGGQDMKALFVQDGYLQNIELNEACSSGCGSFIESFARAMGYPVAEFAQLACAADAPCDLGTRCTVFMNSKVKQALREGAGIEDISAGLAYSVIKNAIHKVLKLTDTTVLGECILVQGGTFRNPAVQRALERLLGKEVICPDIAELMGAYGAALTARDRAGGATLKESAFVGLDRLDDVRAYDRKTINCRGCDNRCMVSKLTFPNGNVCFTGNRCERIFSNSGAQRRKGTDLFAFKYQLLFEREPGPTDAALTLGIPRVLNLYENYPFWHALFTASGLQVRLSASSNSELYQQGVGAVMSENICFPAKLVHGHILYLIQAGVDRIFYPMVFYEKQEFTNATNCYNCPIVTGYPDVIGSAMDPNGQYGIPLDQPAITFKDEKLLQQVCLDYLTGLGISPRTARSAFSQAQAAQLAYKEEVRAAGQQVLATAEVEERQPVILIGRPYHLDPMINHKVPQILADLGMDVIPEDALPLPKDGRLGEAHVLTQWAYHNRDYHAAAWAAQHPNVELVQLNSFGCGPDAVSVDEVRRILSQHGKRHTVIRVDEIVSTGSVKLRLRSLAESLNGAGETSALPRRPRPTTKAFGAKDRYRTILVPEFSHFNTLPFIRPLMDLGYRVEALPSLEREAVDVGLKYTNNEICYPAILIVGQVIAALKSGKYDPDQVAVGLSQTGGACRASCYIYLIKRALVSAGYEQVPVIAVAPGWQSLNDQPGFQLDMKRYIYKTAVALFYTDGLSTLYHATAAREQNKGQALQLANRYLGYLADGSMALTRSAMLTTLAQAVHDFNRVNTDDAPLPLVGLVGEIYVRDNWFSNHHVASWLMEQGVEVVVPPLMDFFLAWLVVVPAFVRIKLDRRKLSWWLIQGLHVYVRHVMAEVDGVMSAFRYYRPAQAIDQIAHNAEEIVSMANQYGEGWLLTGTICTLVKEGIPNLLCLQPFGCLPNHIVAKGVEKRLKQRYPALNLLMLDTDAGTSEVNYFNRLHFFVDRARRAQQVEGSQECRSS